MLCLCRRSLSSLLRSSFHLRGDDAAAAVSCSFPFSDPNFGIKNLHSRAGNAILWRHSQLCCSQGSFVEREQVSFPLFRCFSHGSDTVSRLDRKFLVQLWVSDKKKLKAMGKRYRNASKRRGSYPENNEF